jgi:hypothetical protein
MKRKDAIEWRDFCKHFTACVWFNIFAMSVEYFDLCMVSKTKWQFSFQLWGLKPAVVHLWWRSTVRTPDSRLLPGPYLPPEHCPKHCLTKALKFQNQATRDKSQGQACGNPSIVLKLIQLNWCQLLACKNTYPGSTQCWWFHPDGCSLEIYKTIVGKLVSFDPIIKLSIITQLVITYLLVIDF